MSYVRAMRALKFPMFKDVIIACPNPALKATDYLANFKNKKLDNHWYHRISKSYDQLSESEEPDEESGDEESEGAYYSVEKLIDVRKVGRHIEIKVRWEGYDSRYDTCEPTQQHQETQGKSVSEFNNAMKAAWKWP